MKYVFKFKKGFFWKKKVVIGHKYNREMDRLALLFENGGIYEVANWSKYDCDLGSDWAAAVKKDLEKQAGQQIPVDRVMDAN